MIWHCTDWQTRMLKKGQQSDIHDSHAHTVQRFDHETHINPFFDRILRSTEKKAYERFIEII